MSSLHTARVPTSAARLGAGRARIAAPHMPPMLTRLLQCALCPVPSQCMVCHAWPAQTLCAACVGRFATAQPRCSGCALPVPAGVSRCGACLRQPPPLQACLSALTWEWPWDACIQRMKLGQDPGLAAPLARLLVAAPGVADALAAAHAVLPMPMSPWRLAERGYNPAQLLARHVAPELTQADWLLRVRHTPAQRGLSREQRLKNLRNAFALAPSHVASVQGRHLLLLDDVMTTGASLHEAARTLLQAGAAQVTAVVLARVAQLQKAGTGA